MRRHAKMTIHLSNSVADISSPQGNLSQHLVDSRSWFHPPATHGSASRNSAPPSLSNEKGEIIYIFEGRFTNKCCWRVG